MHIYLVCIREGDAGVHQRLGRYLMMERKRPYLKWLICMCRWSASGGWVRGWICIRIISSSAFDGYRQACKCRTRSANKWHSALYFQPSVRANKPRGGKQAIDPSAVTFCDNSWESFANTLNPVLILHGRRVCQKRSRNTKGAVTWIWMTLSMWRKELSVQRDTCCKTKAPLAIMP